MPDWLKHLFCRHNWEHYIYNIETNIEYRPLTIAIKNCRKCAGWKIIFVFVNEPKND